MGKLNLYSMDDLKAAVAEHDARLTVTGEVWLDHKRDGHYLAFEEYQGKNLITTEGLAYMLNVAATPSSGGTAKETAWYCGLFKNSSYTPAASNTAANTLSSTGLCTECQDADYGTPATNRNPYTIVTATAGVITNAASKADFTIAASITVYGAFIASSQAKTATTGKLLAVKKFDTARAVIASDILSVIYQITLTSA